MLLKFKLAISTLLYEFPAIRRLLFNLKVNILNIFCNTQASCEVTSAKYRKHFISSTKNIDNSMWGLAKHFKIHPQSNVYWEHGFFWNGITLRGQATRSIQEIITMNPRRIAYIEQTLGIPARLAPDVMAHVTSCKETERAIGYIRSKYGKNIELVLSQHSTKHISEGNIVVRPGSDDMYTLNLLFYRDMVEFCSESAMNISCGNRYDPMFLSRLKAILLTADNLQTNCYGTHIIYAAQVGKKFERLPDFNDPFCPEYFASIASCSISSQIESMLVQDKKYLNENLR